MSGSDLPILDPLRRKLSYRATLGEADEAALLQLPHSIRSFRPGRRILGDPAQANTTCILLSGFGFCHKLVANGARQIVSLQMIGDIVSSANMCRGPNPSGFEALTALECAFVPREEIVRLAEARPAIALALWTDTLAEVSMAREWTSNIGRRSARARLAHLLCEWAVRLKVAELGEETHYELPMKQEQLADALGLTPAHVSRTLKDLCDEGLISRSRRFIGIDDWKKLAKVGDFDPGYLHLRIGEPAVA